MKAFLILSGVICLFVGACSDSGQQGICNAPDHFRRGIYDSLGSYSELQIQELQRKDSTIRIQHSIAGWIVVSWEYDGFHQYRIYSRHERNSSAMVADSIPITQFVSDSIAFINGDTLEDFVIRGRYTNGRYQNQYVNVYFEDDNRNFIEIREISGIVNPQFVHNGITSVENLDSSSIRYNYSWVGRFELKKNLDR